MNERPKRVLITGGRGYLGRLLVRRLAEDRRQFPLVVSTDICPREPLLSHSQVMEVTMDVRDPGLALLVKQHHIDTLVHLASIVRPRGPKYRGEDYSVDVLGTQNVVEACLAAEVDQLIVTSSGGAYGYYADNPRPLREDHPLRGNRSIAYADHKRQVEELLAEYRVAQPQLKQLIFRPGTILGQQTDNAITALWNRRWVLGLRGYEIPFVFIWDEDVIECIWRGILQSAVGIYNLAGDGTLSMRQLAQLQNKRLVELPTWLLAAWLQMLRWTGMSPFGAEQVDFLRFRPVLANDKLKREFGYTPRKTTQQAFEYFLQHRQ